MAHNTRNGALRRALSTGGPIPEIWGANVVKARERKSWTMPELAEASGVDWSTIYRIEHGSCPSIMNMVAIAHALGAKPARLFPLPDGDTVTKLLTAA